MKKKLLEKLKLVSKLKTQFKFIYLKRFIKKLYQKLYKHLSFRKPKYFRIVKEHFSYASSEL